MAFKVFLDANFLLDLILHRAEFATADAIMKSGVKGEIQLYTTPAILHITAYFTSQVYTRIQSKQIILTLLNDVKIIDCDHTTALMAISSNFEDMEDAMQYFTAIKFGIDYFLSADKKLKKTAIPQLPIYTATEFFEKHYQK